MNKPIVFLDLDNTILDFDRAEKIALTRAFSENGIDPAPELLSRYNIINGLCWEKLETGELTREQVLVKRFELVFEEFGINADADKIQIEYENYLSEGHYFMPDAEKVLNELFGKYRLFITSNGCASVQDSRLKSSGIEHFFENIFISEKLGYDKPSVLFFSKCIDAIPGYSRDNAIIVGDSLTSDIRGGINIGIKTCWINLKSKEPDKAKPDYIISRLDELPALLEEIF